MMKRMKTVSLFASVMLSVLMAPVPAAQAAEDARETAAQACLASSTAPAAAQEASEDEQVSRGSETHADLRGYCTGDCSPCTQRTTECQKRGQGSCTPISACRQSPQP